MQRLHSLLLLATAMLMACDVSPSSDGGERTRQPLPDHVVQTDPRGLPPGLEPVLRPPEGIIVTSGSEAIEIEVDRSGGATADTSVEFYIAYPHDTPIAPEILEHQFASTAGGATPEPESREPESRNHGEALEWTEVVFAEDVGVVRFTRLVRVELQLAPPHPLTKQPRSLDRLVLRFPFGESVSAVAVLDEFAEEAWGFGRILRRLVSNPDAIALYASRLAPHEHTRAQHAVPWSPMREDPEGEWMRIGIAEDGLYRITPETFESAGVAIQTVDPRQVRIVSRGIEIPTLLVGPATDRFTPNHHIVFYGQGSRSEYARERAYWVRCDSGAPGSSPPQRMEAAGDYGFPKGAFMAAATGQGTWIAEKDLELKIEYGEFMSMKGHDWVWTEVGDGKPSRVLFDLPSLSRATSQSVTLDLDFYFFGLSMSARPLPPPSQPILVQINGGERRQLPVFASRDTDKVQLELPPALLREKDNELLFGFERPVGRKGSVATVYLDRIVARYERKLLAGADPLRFETHGRGEWLSLTGLGEDVPYVIDVTDPDVPRYHRPQPVPPSAYLVREPRAGRSLIALAPSAVRPVGAARPPVRGLASPQALPITHPDNEADYLIVYHGMFAGEMAPLVGLREQAGMRVRTVDVDEVFREYAAGESTPHALKDFLTDALRRWRVPPTYVLLLGDASADYRDRLGTGIPNLVPAYTEIGSEGDLWASELWYATLLGGDSLPDLALGRISVNSVEDAREVIRKTVAYASSPPLGPWRGRFAYFADDSEPGLPFDESIRALRVGMQPRSYRSEMLSLSDFPYQDNFYISNADLVRSEDLKVSTAATLGLLGMMNRGSLVLAFAGHGSPNLWCTERVWYGADNDRSDNRNLRNGGRLPFVVSFTCNQGAFDYANPHRLDLHVNISEDMMRAPEGGAVAMYVPSGPGLPTVHADVAKDLFRALERESCHRIGDAVVLSRILSLLGIPNSAEMIRMSVLLGDPALDLAGPKHVARGGVEPPVVSALEKSDSIVFHGTTPDVPTGRFVGALYAPDGELVAESGALPYSSQRIEWLLPLPHDAPDGLWTVRVYYGNDETAEDGILWGEFERTRPLMQMLSLRIEEPSDGVGSGLNCTVDAQNDSALPAEGVSVEVTFLDSKRNAILPSVTQMVDFGARERRQVVVALDPTRIADACGVRARILDYTTPGDSTRAAQASLVVSLPGKVLPPALTGGEGGEFPADLRIQPGSIRFTPEEPVEGETIFIHAIAENIGQGWANAFEIRAAAKQGDDAFRLIASKPETRQWHLPSLGSGSARAFTLRWDFPALASYAGEHTVEIQLNTGGNVRESSVANNSAQAVVRVLSRADVRSGFEVVESRLSSSPDGQTKAYVKARVRNAGEAPARQRRVGFYRKAPRDMKDYLDPEFLVHEKPLEPIDGGEERFVSHTWIVETVDADTTATARVYHNLETIRAETEGDAPPPPEW